MEILKTIWDFFQNEILGMAWLHRLIGSLLIFFGLDTNGKIGRSVQFFIYDMIKIMEIKISGESEFPAKALRKDFWFT